MKNNYLYIALICLLWPKLVLANQQTMICEHELWKGFRYFSETRILEVRSDGKWVPFCFTNCFFEKDSVVSKGWNNFISSDGEEKLYESLIIVDFFLSC